MRSEKGQRAQTFNVVWRPFWLGLTVGRQKIDTNVKVLTKKGVNGKRQKRGEAGGNGSPAVLLTARLPAVSNIALLS